MGSKKPAQTGALYQRIAGAVVDVAKCDSKVLCLAEAGPAWSSVAVFCADDSQVYYHDAEAEDEEEDVFELVMEAWDAEPQRNRWSMMELVVENGQFDAQFTFPDEFDAGEDEFERRNRIVRKHFGDKPIKYD